MKYDTDYFIDINNTKNDRNCQDMNSRKIVLIALYTALFVVLSLYGTVNVYNMKLTLQNLPIYIGAITMGSVPGSIIGFVGMFTNQMITYGFTATTLLWVLPQTVVGALCGYLFENKYVKPKQSIKFYICMVLLQAILTIINTVIICVDAVVYGYYNYILVFGPLIPRIMVAVLTGIIYCLIIPLIVNAIKKIH